MHHVASPRVPLAVRQHTAEVLHPFAQGPAGWPAGVPVEVAVAVGVLFAVIAEQGADLDALLEDGAAADQVRAYHRDARTRALRRHPSSASRWPL